MKLGRHEKIATINCNNILIGFAGYETEDLVLWSSQILKETGKRVLIVDFTVDNSMNHIFPLPEGYAKIKGKVFEYQGIYYVRPQEDEQLKKYKMDFDIIISDFGCQVNNAQLKTCDVVYIVTTLDIRKLERIRDIAKGNNYKLIMKEYVKLGGLNDYVHKELGYDKENVFIIDRNEVDYKSFLLGQWNQDINIANLSYQVKEVMQNILMCCISDQNCCKELMRRAIRG